MAWGDRIARLESTQNGKLLAEMRAQANVIKDRLYYFGGVADKIECPVIPLDRRSVLNYLSPVGFSALSLATSTVRTCREWPGTLTPPWPRRASRPIRFRRVPRAATPRTRSHDRRCGMVARRKRDEVR